jgi:predicted metal-dependent hydrolase
MLSDIVKQFPYAMALAEAIELFNRQQFYDCHEVLEDDCWRPETHQPDKLWLQGILQIAVGYHHASQHNAKGTRNLLKRGLANINQAKQMNSLLSSSINHQALEEVVAGHIAFAEDWVAGLTTGNRVEREINQLDNSARLPINPPVILWAD